MEAIVIEDKRLLGTGNLQPKIGLLLEWLFLE